MTVPVKYPFFIKRHSLRPRITHAVVDSDGDPVDLTTVTAVLFMMNDSLGVEKVNAAGAVVSPATAGVVEYVWLSGDTDTEGEFHAEFQVAFVSATDQRTVPEDSYIGVTIHADLNDA